MEGHNACNIEDSEPLENQFSPPLGDVILVEDDYASSTVKKILSLSLTSDIRTQTFTIKTQTPKNPLTLSGNRQGGSPAGFLRVPMNPGEILPSIAEGHGAEGTVKNLPKGSLQMPVFSFLCVEKILVIPQHQKGKCDWYKNTAVVGRG